MFAYEELKRKFDEANFFYEADNVDGTNLLRTFFTFEDTNVRATVLVVFPTDESEYKIYIANFMKAELGTSQVPQMLEVCNEFNASTKFLKMYMDSEGALVVERDAALDTFSTDDVIHIILGGVGIIEDKYIKRLLKIKWS